MSDEPTPIGEAAREIQAAMEHRWPNANCDQAELGLLAEALGIDATSRTIPTRPALKIGAVLVAARAAVGRSGSGDMRIATGADIDEARRRHPMLAGSNAELERRRQEIIETFRGPTIPAGSAVQLSDERERIEVELERRTRPSYFAAAARQERAATLREAISLAPHEITCTCPHGGDFDWGLHADDCPRRQVGQMLSGLRS